MDVVERIVAPDQSGRGQDSGATSGPLSFSMAHPDGSDADGSSSCDLGRALGGHSRFDDFAACRAMIQTGSRSFYAASFFLPKPVREAAYAIYAFCRLSDDLIDLEGGQGSSLARLRDRLDGVYAGRPGDHPVDRRLADVVDAYDVPRLAFDMLLEGLSWDAEGRLYRRIEDVEAYAERVAGSVGAMMAALMGQRGQAMASRACDLGVAMQLTNIARDVGEDARMGRLYLPRDWMQAEGLDPDLWLTAPSFSPALGRVVSKLLRRAERRYRQADQAIARLPLAFRPAIMAARLFYAEIGSVLRGRGYDSISARARVGGLRKSQLAALAAALALRPSRAAEPIKAGRPRALAEALAAAPKHGFRQNGGPGELRGVALVIDLFDRLEHRDRQALAYGRAGVS